MTALLVMDCNANRNVSYLSQKFEKIWKKRRADQSFEHSAHFILLFNHRRVAFNVMDDCCIDYKRHWFVGCNVETASNYSLILLPLVCIFDSVSFQSQLLYSVSSKGRLFWMFFI